VVRLLPRMALEPPAGYVSFVARQINWLRTEVTQAVGDEHDADELYPEVLSDVARWWHWLELRRVLLGQPRAADEYLHHALARRVRRFDAERFWGREGEEVWSGEIQVWHREDERPYWSSSAVRLAPYLRTTVRLEFSPIAEAAIAWWHAYETRRRRRVIAALVALLLLVAVLMRLQVGAGATA
jgi:hypothetical protein